MSKIFLDERNAKSKYYIHSKAAQLRNQVKIKIKTEWMLTLKMWSDTSIDILVSSRGMMRYTPSFESFYTEFKSDGIASYTKWIGQTCFYSKEGKVEIYKKLKNGLKGRICTKKSKTFLSKYL